MTAIRYMGVVAGAALLTGCVGYNMDAVNSVEPVGSPFTQALTLEYRDLANFEYDEMQDYRDADAYAQKGLLAASGEVVQPNMLENWHIDEEFLPELSDARGRLVSALDGSARDSFPAEAARAQAMFDCWVEQQEENLQPEDIAACRDEFFAALAIIEAPAVDPVAVYYVFFDWDSFAITEAGQAVIDTVIADYTAMGMSGIDVAGYTDTSGNPVYNLALSERRAEAVESALVAGGIPEAAIATGGFGETDLLVATPDGVREAANRRAEIRFN